MQVDWLIKSRTPKWLLLICLLALLVLTLVAYNGSDEAFMATDDSQEEVLAEHGKSLPRLDSQDLLVTQDASWDTHVNQLTCREDTANVKRLLNIGPEEVLAMNRTYFYQTVMAPIQSGCTLLKKLGGHWDERSYDGGKFICMDDLKPGKPPCIIYSIGIGHDVTFEKSILQHGCHIYSYDHTIPPESVKRARPQQNYFIFRKGIGLKETEVFTTLEKEFQRFGHTNSPITYLKADVEGSELQLLPAWIKAGLLDNVAQLAFEFHTKRSHKNLSKFFRIMQALLVRGFKIIAFDPNLVAGSGTFDGGFMPLFEIVFRKVKTPCAFDQGSPSPIETMVQARNMAI